MKTVTEAANDAASETRKLSGIKVMVIDDSNTIRRSAEIFLAQAGCAVILAEDGFEALSKIAARCWSESRRPSSTCCATR